MDRKDLFESAIEATGPPRQIVVALGNEPFPSLCLPAAFALSLTCFSCAGFGNLCEELWPSFSHPCSKP